MTSTELKELIKTDKYNFLRTNKHIANKVSLLAMGGSIAYGTNLETSDIDIRGIALNNSKQIFNLEPDFEQVVDIETDTVVYSMNKVVKLLISCNPNTIEILGCKPEHYLYKNEVGEQILSNKNAFLSIKAIDSFGGYANQQYNRLEHGLLENGNNDDKKLQLLKHSLQRSLESFYNMHKDTKMQLVLDAISTEELIKLYPKREIDSDISNEHIVLSGNLDKVPITDFKSTISILHKVQTEYGNINKRNTKKTDFTLAKHMMHLIRLYYMGIDLNEQCKITTYQGGDRHDILMDIRTKKYMTKDGLQVMPEFYELLHDVQSRYDYSLKHTVLPEKPNYDIINNMLISIYQDYIKE